MRVLFDQATPVPIREFLIGHTVRTAAQEHWDTLNNGDLLTAAEHAGFEVFLTTDKNLQYQQNLAGRTMAIVVIAIQQWPALQPHVARVVAADEIISALGAGGMDEVYRATDSKLKRDVAHNRCRCWIVAPRSTRGRLRSRPSGSAWMRSHPRQRTDPWLT